MGHLLDPHMFQLDRLWQILKETEKRKSAEQINELLSKTKEGGTHGPFANLHCKMEELGYSWNTDTEQWEGENRENIFNGDHKEHRKHKIREAWRRTQWDQWKQNSRRRDSRLAKNQDLAYNEKLWKKARQMANEKELGVHIVGILTGSMVSDAMLCIMKNEIPVPCKWCQLEPADNDHTLWRCEKYAHHRIGVKNPTGEIDRRIGWTNEQIDSKQKLNDWEERVRAMAKIRSDVINERHKEQVPIHQRKSRYLAFRRCTNTQTNNDSFGLNGLDNENQNTKRRRLNTFVPRNGPPPLSSDEMATSVA